MMVFDTPGIYASRDGKWDLEIIPHPDNDPEGVRRIKEAKNARRR